jgi:ankyrin repeat protein
MPLLELPNELLLYIAQSLHSERDINAFSRANQRLHHLLEGYRYRHNVLHGKSSALRWAANYGQETTARKSISQGAIINARHEFEESPLDIAISGRHIGMIKLLVDHGAALDYGYGDSELRGMSPLAAAVGASSKAVIKTLIEKGYDVNMKDRIGASALSYAAMLGDAEVI